jgi:hypothetical protein
LKKALKEAQDARADAERRYAAEQAAHQRTRGRLTKEMSVLEKQHRDRLRDMQQGLGMGVAGSSLVRAGVAAAGVGGGGVGAADAALQVAQHELAAARRDIARLEVRCMNLKHVCAFACACA